ncbi:MAG: hypothetical protein CMM52_16475 [Rhodospirillaceae bacterium]|nr:hypothetical protein [Rhodospirillaceae bacterium]|tara:strand:- start:5928 stop:6359 length:432 start_codon:yes stop_codon:yes gene_type:complete
MAKTQQKTVVRENDIRSDEFAKLADDYYHLDLKNVIFDKDGKDFVAIDCPACGGTDHELSTEIHQFSYRLCEICDTLFVSPRPTPEKLGRWYTDSEYVGKIRFQNLAQHRDQRYANIVLPRISSFLEKVSSSLNKSITILDIG